MQGNKILVSANGVLLIVLIMGLFLAFHKIHQSDVLIQRVQLMQLPPSLEKTVVLDASSQIDERTRKELDELYMQIAELRDSLSLSSNIKTIEGASVLDTDKKLDVAQNISNTENNLPNSSSEEQQSTQKVTQLFGDFAQAGYLYKKDWESINKDVSALSKDENKMFWMKTVAAIENGQLEMYDE